MVIVLVDLSQAGADVQKWVEVLRQNPKDDRVGLAGAALCVLVAGRESPGVCEGFFVGKRDVAAEGPFSLGPFSVFLFLISVFSHKSPLIISCAKRTSKHGAEL